MRPWLSSSRDSVSAPARWRRRCSSRPSASHRSATRCAQYRPEETSRAEEGAAPPRGRCSSAASAMRNPAWCRTAAAFARSGAGPERGAERAHRAECRQSECQRSERERPDRGQSACQRLRQRRPDYRGGARPKPECEVGEHAGRAPPTRFGNNQPGGNNRFGNNNSAIGRAASAINRPGRVRQQPVRRARLHQSRPAPARRERRDAAAAAGAALHPPQRDVRGARPHRRSIPCPASAISPACRPSRETRFVTHRNGLPVGSRHHAAGDRGDRAAARSHDPRVQRSALTGATLVHFRIGGNRAHRATSCARWKPSGSSRSRTTSTCSARRPRPRPRPNPRRRNPVRAATTSNMWRTSCGSPRCTRSRPART